MPRTDEYQNEFEKQIFMAINNCRINPKRFVPIVRDTAATHVLAKSVPSDTVKNLIAHLQKCEPLGYVSFDEQANKACLQNNTVITEKNEAVPAKGGNIVVYNEIAGSDKTVMCEEYTMCKYEGSSANEFIALELILDWDRRAEAVVKTSTKVEAEVSPDTKVEAVVSPVTIKDDAGTKKTQDLAKGPLKKSPILNGEIQSVGISNKAHRTVVNLIQVLYVKRVVNTME